MAQTVKAEVLKEGDYYKVARDPNLYRVKAKSPRGDVSGKIVCRHNRKKSNGKWVQSWVHVIPVPADEVQRHRQNHAQWMEL